MLNLAQSVDQKTLGFRKRHSSQEMQFSDEKYMDIARCIPSPCRLVRSELEESETGEGVLRIECYCDTQRQVRTLFNIKSHYSQLF